MGAGRVRERNPSKKAAAAPKIIALKASACHRLRPASNTASPAFRNYSPAESCSNLALSAC